MNPLRNQSRELRERLLEYRNSRVTQGTEEKRYTERRDRKKSQILINCYKKVIIILLKKQHEASE